MIAYGNHIPLVALGLCRLHPSLECLMEIDTIIFFIDV